MKKSTEEKTVHLLLTGKHPKIERFAGHHVLVINDKIILLKEGKEGVEDIEFLEEKYGHTPTIVFVPRQDISYILVVCRS